MMRNGSGWKLAVLLGAGIFALKAETIAPITPMNPIEIGSRLELFVDDFLIEKRDGVELRLHAPVPREAVLVHDAPWEGIGCGYHTVFRDGDLYRMYYVTGDPRYACYAESKDGIHWVKPALGLVEFKGAKTNNIVWTAPKADNFTVFKDPNPACRSDARYKAVAQGPGGLWAYMSADGLSWSKLVDQPILAGGGFDSQNTAFWDPLRHQYFAYVRGFQGPPPADKAAFAAMTKAMGDYGMLRAIYVATSTDFLTWTKLEPLRFGDAPAEQLYTNGVFPYPRAPHLFVGFPTRYVLRRWSPAFDVLPDPVARKTRMKECPRYGTAITETLFMTSRDGRMFDRWGEAFIRPGPERPYNWVYGDGYQGWGLVETPAADPLAPPEFSLYVGENSNAAAVRLRRYTMRLDGFVSLNAPLRGGEMRTKSILFSGKNLTLNFSSSAAGSIRVELQDSGGQPFPGYALGDSDEIFGDSLARTVTWNGKSDLGQCAGQPVRLRFVLKDADLYALQFK